MNEEKQPQQSPSPPPEADRSSALEHDTKRVEDITQSKDRDRDDDEAGRAKAEAPKRVEQDAAVEAVKRQAKEAGAGSTEPADNLNQDG